MSECVSKQEGLKDLLLLAFKTGCVYVYVRGREDYTHTGTHTDIHGTEKLLVVAEFERGETGSCGNVDLTKTDTLMDRVRMSLVLLLLLLFGCCCLR